MPASRENENERRREAAATRQRAAAIAREDERALRRASARTRRAVSAVLAEQRAAAGGLRPGAPAAAWLRAPSPSVMACVNAAGSAAWSTRAGRGPSTPIGGGIDPRHSPIHFSLSQSHSAGAAAAHQRYIEREGACVASFGNLADSQAERVRLWEAIADCTHVKSGSMRIDFTDDPDLAKRVMDTLPDWTSSGLLTVGAGRAVAACEDAPDPAPAAPPEPDLPDAADPEPISRRAERLREKRLDNRPEQSVTLWVKDPEAYQAVLDETLEWLPEPERKQRGQKRVQGRAPRSPIVQRRMVLELAHELDDEARERVLAFWCEETFGRAGVAWHAAIHTP